MTVKEITIEEMLHSYDWEEVFGEGSGGNCTSYVQQIPGSNVSTAPVTRSQVIEVIAAVNGENDEEAWIGLFRLNDGRFLIAEGSCDYTGWDCRAGNSLLVTDTLERAIQLGLNAEQQERLGLVP